MGDVLRLVFVNLLESSYSQFAVAQHVAHDITARLCALPLERAVAADSESVDDEPLFPPRDPDEEPH